jgi:hypothetical protein
MLELHYMSVPQRIRKALLNPIWVCFFWAGMTFGITMIARPVRFTAASITRSVALDVGRVFFAALDKAELLAQGACLIPELASRTDIIMSGGELRPSSAHAIYSSRAKE